MNLSERSEDKELLSEVQTKENIFNNIKKNICFIHSCTLSNTKRLEYLINYLKNSKLYNILDKIYINNIGLNIKLDNILDSKIELFNYSENNNLFEIPTLNTMLKYSKNEYENCNILYLHNKGISYNDNYEELNNWIDMMLYFLIDKYEVCLDKLLLHDVVGSNYIDEQYEYFSGNFWWATSEYLKNLSEFDETNINKMEAEKWLFSNNPVYYEMHNSKINHYHISYPKDKYCN
jgi:hypothetical protein